MESTRPRSSVLAARTQQTAKQQITPTNQNQLALPAIAECLSIIYTRHCLAVLLSGSMMRLNPRKGNKNKGQAAAKVSKPNKRKKTSLLSLPCVEIPDSILGVQESCQS